MAVSAVQRAQDAYNAGFRNSNSVEALSIIVAISLAECGIGSGRGCEFGCNPDAGSISCGIWQIYQPAHPGTSACASDPACCATLAWGISGHGTNFSPWSTYTNNAFRAYLGQARAAVAAISGNPAPVPAPPVRPPVSPPTPPAPAPATGSSLGWLLLLTGAGALGYLGWRRQGLAVTGDGFGAAKIVRR